MKAASHDDVFIGQHPIELYYQVSEFQDFMSVGCYDLLEGRWEVGPEMTDKEFDPYSEYFDVDMRGVKSIMADVRNTILRPYEKLVAYKNSSDQDFRDELAVKITADLEEAVKLFE